MSLTIRSGLGLARTVTFLYDQSLVSGWLATSHRLLSLKPDLSHTRTSRRAGLDIARSGPYQTIDCHEIFLHGIQAFLSWNVDQRQDRTQTRTSRLTCLDIARPGPGQTIDCHEIFPHGLFRSSFSIGVKKY